MLLCADESNLRKSSAIDLLNCRPGNGRHAMNEFFVNLFETSPKYVHPR